MSHTIYPPLKLRVFVDDITALVMEGTKEVLEMEKKVMKRLKGEVEKKSFKLSVTEHGKGRKEQDDCVVWFPGGRDTSMQQGRGSDVGRQCRNTWSGLV